MTTAELTKVIRESIKDTRIRVYADFPLDFDFTIESFKEGLKRAAFHKGCCLSLNLPYQIPHEVYSPLVYNSAGWILSGFTNESLEITITELLNKAKGEK